MGCMLLVVNSFLAFHHLSLSLSLSLFSFLSSLW